MHFLFCIYFAMIVVPFKHGHKLAYTQVNEHAFKRSPPNIFAYYWLCMSTTPPPHKISDLRHSKENRVKPKSHFSKIQQCKEIQSPYLRLNGTRPLHSLTMSVSQRIIVLFCSFHCWWIRLDGYSAPIVVVFHSPWRLMRPLSKYGQLEDCLAIAKGSSSV